MNERALRIKHTGPKNTQEVQELTRAELQEQIDEFLRNGGKIKHIPVGETALDYNSGKKKTRKDSK